MNEEIARILGKLGWTTDRVKYSCFSRSVDTFRGPQSGHASIWLINDKTQGGYWLKDADFTSTGVNVLAIHSLYLREGLTPTDLEHMLSQFVNEMNESIEDAYSVRLLRSQQPDTPQA